MFKVKMAKSDWHKRCSSPFEDRIIAPKFLSGYVFNNTAWNKRARLAWFIARLFGAHVEYRGGHVNCRCVLLGVHE